MTMLQTMLASNEFSRAIRPESVPPQAEARLVTSVPLGVAVAKRGLDIFVALMLLIFTAPLWPLLALAIRIDSRGPVIFQQQRVGRVLANRTELFMMLKFRSMRVDAETVSGAVWAVKNDPRITRVGWILRKTRLDELPQLLNVLRGDMSMVGPRPERPCFYRGLTAAIPCFAQRTADLRPGITGLAQTRQGYDTCIDDVRRKVGFDRDYAHSLRSFQGVVKADVSIMARTVVVMIAGRGQ